MLSKTKPPLYSNAASGNAFSIIGLLSKVQWDNWLFLLLCLLLTLSFGMLYSASGQKISTMMKQGVHLLVGLSVFFVIAQMSPRTFKKMAPILYGIGVILLFAVLVFGSSSKGAQRWVNLGPIRFQPSEFLKLIVPLMMAFYLANKSTPLRKMPILISLVIIFVPGLLIAKQPDLGTALLVIATGFGVLFFAGIRWSLIIKMTCLALAGLPLLWWKLHDYQKQRVMTFLNPERDPLGSGYHIIQSKIAIGSGGTYGKGWCEGTQSQLNFLPERTTDFIFSVLGEEFGFMGAIVLCLLYFSIILRGIIIMTNAKEAFDRLLAGGIIFGFFVCFFINIGMVSGMLPVVGCPLPLMSYGGTSLVTWMAAFGILVAIQSHNKSLPR